MGAGENDSLDPCWLTCRRTVLSLIAFSSEGEDVCRGFAVEIERVILRSDEAKISRIRRRPSCAVGVRVQPSRDRGIEVRSMHTLDQSREEEKEEESGLKRFWLRFWETITSSIFI
ncbi:unnamed protein product [Pleuronectes platessa]|uniref:Uncharacterized protein n=1 Tax=Pleuronectes platessa TaxID=8262 RepID=A0A9N7TVG1_PLEPL|nr:unnamed protein product [Pleuronectes platessa]